MWILWTPFQSKAHTCAAHNKGAASSAVRWCFQALTKVSTQHARFRWSSNLKKSAKIIQDPCSTVCHIRNSPLQNMIRWNCCAGTKALSHDVCQYLPKLSRPFPAQRLAQGQTMKSRYQMTSDDIKYSQWISMTHYQCTVSVCTTRSTRMLRPRALPWAGRIDLPGVVRQFFGIVQFIIQLFETWDT